MTEAGDRKERRGLTSFVCGPQPGTGKLDSVWDVHLHGKTIEKERENSSYDSGQRSRRCDQGGDTGGFGGTGRVVCVSLSDETQMCAPILPLESCADVTYSLARMMFAMTYIFV